MMNYDTYLSQAAAAMQESAIRRMGSILAQNRNLISFAEVVLVPEPDKDEVPKKAKTVKEWKDIRKRL